MTKHKTKRRRQKGGAWYDPLGLFTSDTTVSEPYASGSYASSPSIKATAKKTVEDINAIIGSAAQSGIDAANNLASNVTSSFSSPSNSYSPTPSNSYSPSGGRNRRRSRRMKGGKGNLGLTYYATPVAEMNVAKPTTIQFYEQGVNQYSIKGGSRKRKSHRHKTKKHRRSRNKKTLKN